MIRTLGIALIIVLLSGCGAEKSMTPKQPLFQSVSEKDAILLQEGKEKRYCSRCGMDLVRFYKTSHAAEHAGHNIQYCSIHCLEEHLGQGVTLKNPQVVDVASLKFISIADAYYVVGSSKRGTMSRVSKYAFSNISEAQKFQKLYGGEIMRFDGAQQKAKEDFIK
ncbi:MAG: nitrous oxide reductase accessory protein NosL [Sulfurimonas sp.]|jgi:nitrous oxide reductase accessory protein NosL|nr:nitrous oxide reductase accessory protein NosL [Sulfurimonas sp.]